MPTPTIPAGNLFMDATIWTGVNTANAITISNLQFQPDFVWGKSRSLAYGHGLYDSVRGTGKLLVSNNTNAEASNFLYGYISAFNSNGFTATPGSTDNENWNQTSATYVAWNWKAGGTAVSNTVGSITSSVSANTTSGFSVVTYTGNATAGATVGHGLGVAPAMIIVKRRNDVVGWFVWHTAFNSATAKLDLNSTDAIFSSNVYLNSTFPSSSVVTLGTSGYTNASGGTYVMYAFAQIAGYSAFGSYTGNGSADGTFVYLGFRPRFLMIKQANSTNPWIIQDSARAVNNVTGLTLYPNSSAAEESSTIGASAFDFLSNGFKNRDAGSAQNGSGSTYIYMAFCENPFKFANAK